MPSLLFLFATVFAGCSRQNSDHLILPGIVETQEVRLSSKVGGRIDSVFVREGDVVEAGAKLLQIDGAELVAKRAQLVAQKAAFQAKLELLQNGPLPEQIAAARSALDAVNAKLQKIEAGWRSEELEMAKQEVAISQAEYDGAKSEYDRIHGLKGPFVVSQSELDTAKATMLKALGKLRSDSKKLEMLVSGMRPEEIAEAKAEVARLQADYDLIRRGARDEEVRQAEAQVAEISARIDEMDVNLRECTVVAPERCRIEVLAVRHGDVASPNQPLIRVLYNDDLWVKAYVPETLLHRLKLNQKVTVTHDGTKKAFDGVVRYIANASEFTPRNVQSADERKNQVFAIKVRLIDDEGIFKSGMATDVRVPLTSD